MNIFTVQILDERGELFATVQTKAGSELEANAKAREYVKRCHPILRDEDLQTFVPMS